MDTGDTGFIMMCTALVFIMTPGLAFFYGGMVRKKNVLSTLMHSWVVIGIMSLQWILVGYTLAFGPDYHGLIGGLNWLGLNGVGMDPNPDYAATLPAIVFMGFQMMFAVITPALISGSIAERMKFPAFILFMVLWATFVYDPLAHWVWGVGGFLRTLGALDFAGGNVVHISSGYAALIAAILLGKRKGLGKDSMAPHHVPMTVLGAGLLWFGWFGFNAGSALGANGLAGMAFVNTNTAAAAAALAWAVVERIHRGKSTMLGTASGAVAGLVAITPGAGFVTPMSALFIGIVGGLVCYLAIGVIKAKLGYDDALDAFGCHGIGGTWGALATGIFATKSINPAGNDGLFYGNASLLGIQAISVAVTIAFTVTMTFIILKLISVVMKLRVTEEEESNGLDLSLHGERAYSEFM
ncbi:MAG TPA: ammonia channel protein [Desulfosporosinus sp.]|nr:ammonia channel protein [Desulfosporosinus sp.]